MKSSGLLDRPRNGGIKLDFVFEILEHSLEDTWTMIPLLLAAYLVIEWFERRPQDDSPMFFALQKYGPLVGALIGLIPQCGFSVLAGMLFVQGNITLGTLIAVFVATSDEAIPILLSHPDLYGSLVLILILKFFIAVLAGYVTDRLFPVKIQRFEDMPEEEEDTEISEDTEVSGACPCCYPDRPMWQSALLRTLKIYAWVFGVTVVFTALVHGIGEETLAGFLLSGTWFQPILAAVFGFIPNCAATVVLTELYEFGTLSFGSLFAGLVTNAGLGPLVLIQYHAPKQTILRVFLILLVTGAAAGMVLQLL